MSFNIPQNLKLISHKTNFLVKESFTKISSKDLPLKQKTEQKYFMQTFFKFYTIVDHNSMKFGIHQIVDKPHIGVSIRFL